MRRTVRSSGTSCDFLILFLMMARPRPLLSFLDRGGMARASGRCWRRLETLVTFRRRPRAADSPCPLAIFMDVKKRYLLGVPATSSSPCPTPVAAAAAADARSALIARDPGLARCGSFLTHRDSDGTKEGEPLRPRPFHLPQARFISS